MERETDPKKPGIGKTVLVVDDNAAIRKMLATAFLSDGESVTNSGIEVGNKLGSGEDRGSINAHRKSTSVNL